MIIKRGGICRGTHYLDEGMARRVGVIQTQIVDVRAEERRELETGKARNALSLKPSGREA